MTEMSTVNRKEAFRPEIEGLRATAAILVAIYHIWLGRVSGGVDVFFVVTGFLITTALIKQVERSGRIKPLEFWGGLIRRLFPAAFLVLGCVAVASWFWLPKSLWLDTSKQIFASAIYLENWKLALNAVDYLAREEPPSPVQHYWALSIQGQFYALWPFLVAIAARGHPAWFIGPQGAVVYPGPGLHHLADLFCLPDKHQPAFRLFQHLHPDLGVFTRRDPGYGWSAGRGRQQPDS